MSPRTCLIAIALALAATGCVEPSAGTPSSADLADFDVVPSIEVELTEEGFSPDAIEVAANVTVSVTNGADSDRSAVQLDTPADRRFETGELVPGDSIALHLADPGLIELTDTESGHTLTLTVGPEAVQAASSD